MKKLFCLFLICFISCKNEGSKPTELILREGFVRVPSCDIVGIEPSTAVLGKESYWKGVFIKDRKIKLNEYAIAQHELTYKLWKKVYDWAVKNGYSFANEGQKGWSNSYDEKLHSDDEPVVLVSWRDAVVWCNAYTEMEMKNATECVYVKSEAEPTVLKDAKNVACDTLYFDGSKTGFRLPTEAEWEIAARYQGETEVNAQKYGNIYLTNLDSASGATKNVKDSDETGKVAWTLLDSNMQTHKVGLKRLNYLKLYDMSGNVCEWCFDIYEDITVNTAITGAKAGEYRVFRGGQYAVGAEDSCVGIRSSDKTDYILPALGFRLAYTIKK